MREQKFSKEPTLVGDMEIETRYGVYYIRNDESAYPQKIADCNLDGVDSTLSELASRLEKNGLTVEKKSNDEEYYVSGTIHGTDRDGNEADFEIDGTIYAGSYQIILNSIQRKAMERVFHIARRNNDNNRRFNNDRGNNRRNNFNRRYDK